RTGLNLVALFGILAQPFIPTAAAKILDALGIPEENRKMPNPDDENLLDALPHGLEISPPDVLFSKIEDAQVAEWTERFGGGQ
ncbi:MAG TPA: methionine--tRNA ligase, partial [Hyphomonadaceae bacterium]|nr:methionine--tRNA ligase [Hyphomonadaceae bacterium]